LPNRSKHIATACGAATKTSALSAVDAERFIEEVLSLLFSLSLWERVRGEGLTLAAFSAMTHER